MYRNIINRSVCFQNRPLPKSWKQISSIFYWAKTVWHAISRLWKSVNPEYERQNSKMKLREVCPLSLANRKALRMTEFSRHLLYRHSSHNREFHNVNCRFCGAIHDVDWANISVHSQVIHNVNERKTVQTKMISFVSHGAGILKISWSSASQNFCSEAQRNARRAGTSYFVCTVFLFINR